MQPVGLQEWIHKLEEGEGTKYIRIAFMVLALLGLTAVWHIREAKSFSTVAAMDSAQVARNLAQGEGYTTKFVRPFSLALLQEHNGSAAESLRTGHPDISNAPVYPAVLAGLMKVLPFKWEIPTSPFWRYQPEVLIGFFNQLLFFVALFQVFRLATRLFDRSVAFLAVLLMAFTELFWNFTTSGLSTMLLIVLFLALVHVLVRIEEGAREGLRSTGWILGRAALAGLLVGLMALTRYSMGWLIIPVLIYIAGVAMGARGGAVGIAVACFALLLGPWIGRNYAVSGTAFGTAGYDIHHGTSVFPGNRLERSLPKNVGFDLNKIALEEYPRKLFVNTGKIVGEGLPRAAGNWIWALFLASIFIGFRNPGLARLKYFVCGALLTLVFAQALGQTEVSDDTPVYSAENLLVVVAPLFFIFGCALFYILLDQLEFSMPWFRSAAIVGFVAVLSLPLMLRLLPPRSFPVEYPYYAPGLQTIASWMDPEELMMSDMPWAIAWYGDRQAVWTTLDVGEKPSDDFYRINDDLKPVMGLHLTPLTTDAKFLSEMRLSPEGAWAKFYLDVVVLKNLPTGFPLKTAPQGTLPEQLFLSDRIRWR